jgi:hypothetical protein
MCTPVPFTFIQSGTNIGFVAIKTNQQLAVEYVVQWPPISPDAAGPTAGWTDKRPVLAWDFPAQPPLNQFAPALACLCDLSDINTVGSKCHDDVNHVPNPLGAMPIIPNVEPFITLSKPVAQGGQGLTQYLPGTQALMCVAQHGWTSLPNGTIQHWDKVIDLSDGWGSEP